MAEEIQNYSGGVDDYTYRPISITPDGNWFYIKEKEILSYECIWLPRQDQLQDMVGKYQIAYSLMYQYKKTPLYYIGKKPYYPFNVMNSAEILWLCFVMDERYGKRWSGSEWVVK